MAKKCQIAKSKKKPKFSTRLVRRCSRCGRSRGYPFCRGALSALRHALAHQFAGRFYQFPACDTRFLLVLQAADREKDRDRRYPS
ncbi:MAG TPA: hypothetical protein ENK97_03675 [Campylobacteraceae bacterium]|nr:hypothetical protein [Campylobacteraceae bacterium]